MERKSLSQFRSLLKLNPNPGSAPLGPGDSGDVSETCPLSVTWKIIPPASQAFVRKNLRCLAYSRHYIKINCLTGKLSGWEGKISSVLVRVTPLI